MKNQFFYTRTYVTTPKEGEKPEIKTYYESFNINFVIRSVVLEDNRRLVLINDIHERSIEEPIIDQKKNKVTGMSKKRVTYQSEIFLDKDDSERFVKITEIKI